MIATKITSNLGEIIGNLRRAESLSNFSTTGIQKAMQMSGSGSKTEAHRELLIATGKGDKADRVIDQSVDKAATSFVDRILGL